MDRDDECSPSRGETGSSDCARRAGSDRPLGVVIVQYGAAVLHPETVAALGELQAEHAMSGGGAVVVVARSPRLIADRTAPSPIGGAPVVALDRNMGYAAAANAGLAHPALAAAQVIVVVSADVQMDAGCLHELMLAFGADPSLGVAGPILRFEDGQTVAGGTWSRWRGARHHPLSSGDSSSDGGGGAVSPTVSVDWVDGAVIALRRALIDELGGEGPFDSETFLYGEDVQLCVRARRLGWKVAVVGRAVATQRTGLADRPGAHGYLLVRNEFRTAAAAGTQGGRAVCALAGLGRAGWEVAKGVTDRRGLGRRHHALQAGGMVRGAVDGLRGRGGPPPESLRRLGDISATKGPIGADVRVLELITRLDTGGAQAHVAQLSGRLGSAFDVVVAAGELGEAAAQLRRQGVDVRRVDGMARDLGLGEWRSYRSTRRLLEDIRPDVVHAHSSKAGLHGRLAAWRAGVPCVYTVHGWPFRYGPFHHRLVSLVTEWTLGRFAPATVVCVCEADATWARRWRAVPPHRLRVVRHGLPDIAASPRSAPGETPVLGIVMVARCSPQKDHATALHALAACVDLQWHVTFVGDGPLIGAHRRLAASLGLGDRADFVGEVHNVESRLAGADLFLLASLSEGLPISILEAMRAGLATIASSVGGVPEAVLDGETGWLVATRSKGALVGALREAMSSPSELQRRGAAARRRWEAEFREARALAEWREVLTEAAAR